MAEDKAKKVETAAEKKLRRELADATKNIEPKNALPQIRARAKAKQEKTKKVRAKGKRRGGK